MDIKRTCLTRNLTAVVLAALVTGILTACPVPTPIPIPPWEATARAIIRKATMDAQASLTAASEASWAARPDAAVTVTPTPTTSPIFTPTPKLSATRMPSRTPTSTPLPTPTATLPPDTGLLAQGGWSTPVPGAAWPGPALAVGSDGAVHLAWAGGQADAWNIYYTRSADGGDSFEQPAPVAPLAAGRTRSGPALAVSAAGDVYIAWEEKQGGVRNIFYTRAEPGRAFVSPARANDNTAAADHARPALAMGPDGRAHLTWQDARNGGWDVYYARQTQPGSAFSANLRVNDATAGDQVDPAIAVDGQGQVYVAWGDKRSGAWALYYARAGQAGFGRSEPVGSGLLADLGDEYPSLAMRPDEQVHIAWTTAYIREPTYQALLYLPAYAGMTDKGVFSAARQISQGYHYASIRPNETGIVVGADAVHVVLTTYSPRDGSWVWYYRSADGGRTFSAGVSVQQVSGPDALHFPQVAVGPDGRIHVAWAYQRGAAWDIYYARSDDGGKTFVNVSVFL